MPANRLILSALAASIATTGISTLASAGTIRADRSDSQYTSLGNSFSNVGSLYLKGATTAWNCSGTLIGANYLLTAAHCLEDSAQQNLKSGTFKLGSTTYTIKSGVKNSGWETSGRNFTAGTDIAILQLSSNVSGITAASLFTGNNESGQTGTYVGFGNRGTGTTGQVANTFGTKRAGQNILNSGTDLGWSSSLLWSDFTDPRTSSTALNLEYNIAQGDSGGGLFINNQLAGVSSTIQNLNRNSYIADYGDRSLATRISSFSAWIQNVLNAGFPSSGVISSSGTSTTSSSTTVTASSSSLDLLENLPEITMYQDTYSNVKVPEPSTVLALTSIGGIMGWRHRRKGQQKTT